MDVNRTIIEEESFPVPQCNSKQYFSRWMRRHPSQITLQQFCQVAFTACLQPYICTPQGTLTVKLVSSPRPQCKWPKQASKVSSNSKSNADGLMHGNERPGERKQALSVQRLANAVMSVTPYYTHIKRKMAYKSGSTMIPQADMNLQIQESCLLSCLSCLPFCCRLSFQKLFLYVAVYLLLCFKTF